MISKNLGYSYSWRERGWLNWVGHPGFLWYERSNGWWGMPRVHFIVNLSTPYIDIQKPLLNPQHVRWNAKSQKSNEIPSTILFVGKQPTQVKYC